MVERWLPGCSLAADLSWHETDTLVRQLRTPGGDYILKGAGAALRFSDSRARLMILDYLPGRLSEHTTRELDPEFHRQAGRALRILHQGTPRLDAGDESMLLAVSFQRLGQEHRIDPGNERRAYDVLRAYQPQPGLLVPTHGDRQPRNWLSDRGNLKVIDFGRFDCRAPSTDLVRLANQQRLGSLELEAAFLQGQAETRGRNAAGRSNACTTPSARSSTPTALAPWTLKPAPAHAQPCAGTRGGLKATRWIPDFSRSWSAASSGCPGRRRSAAGPHARRTVPAR